MKFLSLLYLFLFVEVSGIRLNRERESKSIVDAPWPERDYQCNKWKQVKGPEKKDGTEQIYMCMDGWEAMQIQHKGKPCVAYDLGVRDDISFARRMIDEFKCEVRAYDPSPHTARWWNTSTDSGILKLKDAEKNGKYKLHFEAATQEDGPLSLFAYNWDQVSVYQSSNKTRHLQKEYVVPGTSFSSMLKNNGDTFVDVMKVDIEGSEFAFLKGMHTSGCPQVEHFIFEWHSTNFEEKLKTPPDVHLADRKLRECGYKRYWATNFYADNNPTSEEKFKISKSWYGFSNYCLTCGNK